MSTKKPEGYAPDLFSEHARLAQLGARVLEILREKYSEWGFQHVGEDSPEAARDLDEKLLHAARSLGLYSEEARHG